MAKSDIFRSRMQSLQTGKEMTQKTKNSENIIVTAANQALKMDRAKTNNFKRLSSKWNLSHSQCE